jgi:hypothetical protein
MQYRRGRFTFIAVLVILLFAGFFTIHAGAPEVPVGPFFGPSARGGLPPDWKPWILNNVKRHTTYHLVEDGSPAIKALADASASGLMRSVTVNPREYPVVQWRWKVAAIIEGADISRKENNDSPARLYVAFAYDIKKVSLFERFKYSVAKRRYSESLPLRAIAYTWANKHPLGSFVPMPYTSWFMQVALENSASPVNEWITEERDVYEDYRKAFGEEPQVITGVAVMTNTDNMGGKAEAWYGNIVFKQRPR